MGWLQRKGRRWPNERATFAQTVAIARDTIRQYPAADDPSRVDRIKYRHLALGFQYDPTAIHRAIAALTDPARPCSRPSDRSRSDRTRPRGAPRS